MKETSFFIRCLKCKKDVILNKIEILYILIIIYTFLALTDININLKCFTSLLSLSILGKLPLLYLMSRYLRNA